AWDVISSTEGDANAIYIHWAPKEADRYLDPEAWTTELLPVSKGATRWMFALPMEIDGKNGVDFFAGSKDNPAYIGWWRSPDNPRDLSAWTWHPLYEAGWIMS